MVGKSINGYLRYKTPMFHVPLPSLSLVQNFESVFNLDPDYVEVFFDLCCFVSERGEKREKREREREKMREKEREDLFLKFKL